MKFYLSGGIEYKSNLGSTWRTWLTKELENLGHLTLDPLKIEQEGYTGDIPIQKYVSDLKVSGNLHRVRRMVREFFFIKDVIAIQESDCVILFYDESVQKGAGTLAEAWEAFREGRPVYLVTEFPFKEIPSWLVGETTRIFSDFDQLLIYLKDSKQIDTDIIRAKEIREQLLGGVYST